MNAVTTRTTTKIGSRSLRVRLAAVLVSGVAALSLVAAPAGAATPTQLTNLRFSWSGGLLTRAQVHYVTVSLTLVDPDGIAPSSLTWSDGPLACRFFYYVSADQLRRSSLVCAAWVAYPTDTPDSFVAQSNTRPHG